MVSEVIVKILEYFCIVSCNFVLHAFVLYCTVLCGGVLHLSVWHSDVLPSIYITCVFYCHFQYISLICFLDYYF